MKNENMDQLKTKLDKMKHHLKLVENLIEQIITDETIIPITKGDIGESLFKPEHLTWCYDHDISMCYVKLYELVDGSVYKEIKEEGVNTFVQSLFYGLPGSYYKFKTKEDAMAFKLKWYGDSNGI